MSLLPFSSGWDFLTHCPALLKGLNPAVLPSALIYPECSWGATLTQAGKHCVCLTPEERTSLRRLSEVSPASSTWGLWALRSPSMSPSPLVSHMKAEQGSGAGLRHTWLWATMAQI